MQLASPITPCAASSFSIFRLSKFVMTISTPSLIRIDHSVPKVCAAVASSPCTFLRSSTSRHHVMLPGRTPDRISSLQMKHTSASVMQKERCKEDLHAADSLSTNDNGPLLSLHGDPAPEIQQHEPRSGLERGIC